MWGAAIVFLPIQFEVEGKRRCHGFVQTFQTLFQKVDPSYVPKELLHHQQW